MARKRSSNCNLNLSVYFYIKQGLSPRAIAKKLNISMSRIQYHLSSLKKQNLIRKIGYGVWEITGFYKKEVQIDRVHYTPHQSPLLMPDLVRGHAFKFILRLPNNLRNWHRREQLLTKLKIPFKKIKWFGNAQRIIFQNRKIILTDSSIVIYERKSYFSDTSTESRSLAISGMLKLIHALERALKANFSHSLGQYKFTISSQHYSLIKNSLARQYDEEGKRLIIYDIGEPWLVIDNSYNLHELETLHPRTAVDDNMKVKTFFNGLRRLKVEECNLQELINRITNLEKKAQQEENKENLRTSYIG